jgi:preprotein translocase subunit SecY
MSGMPGLSNAPELWRRIFFTLTMLLVYRIGVHVPTPGIDALVLQEFFAQNRGTIFGVFNLFSGGALERFSILALGVMPYITASIVFQLLVATIPQLEQIQKEGEQGRRKINQYTRYATIGLALFQGFMMATGLERINQGGVSAVMDPGLAFRIETAITLAAGTGFLMWLGEQITERGVGNGISLIIMAGIAAGIPNGFFGLVEQLRNGQMMPLHGLFLFLFMIAIIGFIVMMERAQRRIPIQYARRVVGRKVYGGMNTHLPLKLNMSGVIPPIFASSIIFFPSTIATFVTIPFLQTIADAMSGMGTFYNFVFGGLVIFFAFFYTAVVFNPMEVAENLRKQGGFVPGIRPGKQTGEYLDYILSRISTTGAVYLTFICIMPAVLITKTSMPFFFGGTSLLILVGVTMDTMAQVESILLSKNYDGIVKDVKIGGRRSSIGSSA